VQGLDRTGFTATTSQHRSGQARNDKGLAIFGLADIICITRAVVLRRRHTPKSDLVSVEVAVLAERLFLMCQVHDVQSYTINSNLNHLYCNLQYNVFHKLHLFPSGLGVLPPLCGIIYH
jgi:hypothetical protein